MPADKSDDRRDRIHALLQELGPPGDDPEDRGSLLLGWALVMEWVSPDGSKFISRGHSAEVATWHAKGLWHEALYGHWPEPDVDDDD